MIKSQNLSKSYRTRLRDKKLVVDNLSFNVEKGKVTGFLGPNGAGKSTTMRLMLGLDYGKGQTTYDGQPLSSYKQPSKVVGILLEAKAFHPTRTPRNHLKILAAAGNIPYARVDEALDVVGLSDVAKKSPGKFSLGMSQRLGIAAAILGHPNYLILDEPANGLDPEGVAWLRKFIKDYADQGNAVFVSSHLLSEMSQMADNVVVIGKGKLIASGSVEKIIAGSTSSKIFVRVATPSKLEELLKQKKFDYEKIGGGFAVSKSKTDDIGKLAFSAKLPVLELAKREASLEEAFLELTEGTAEYKSHEEGGQS